MDTRLLPNGNRVTIGAEGGSWVVDVNNRWVGRFQTTAPTEGRLAPALPVTEGANGQEDYVHGLRNALCGLFESRPDLARIELELHASPDLDAAVRRAGVVLDGSGAYVCLRGMFRQQQDLWLTRPGGAAYPLCYTMTEGKRHPVRPPVGRGEVYGRFVSGLDTVVSFRTIDPVEDIEAFHRWMNTPRVAQFWELGGSLEEHERYLQKVLSDPHMHPVVGCFDGEPFGYFEIYWAKEDRIAPYYEVDDYDRGIHMLVGEERFRGPHRVAAWLPSLAHFLFLDDARTRNVVAEPRADNAKMIGYLQRSGFYKSKEFDFPHKRAAMMILPRDVFFEQFCP
ncbi:MAG: GNAT family N-acetyltransferase [Pseudomonadota bacterium]|jgi:RimJ/RimL family protein N-acetyltransferase